MPELTDTIRTGVVDKINDAYVMTQDIMTEVRFTHCTVAQMKTQLQEIVDKYEKCGERWLMFCDDLELFGADMSALREMIIKRHRRNIKNLEHYALYLVSAKTYKYKNVSWDDYLKKRRSDIDIGDKAVISIKPIRMLLGKSSVELEIEEAEQ